MPLTLLVIVALATSLVAGLPPVGLAADAPGLVPVPLRADPDRLCVASAVAAGRGGTAWVVDNEVDDTLFGFTVEAGVLAAAKAWNVDLSTIPAAERPHDVEAAAVVIRSLVLVGSHSRNEHCEVRPNRERILIADLDEAGKGVRDARAIDDAALMARLRAADDRTCLETLFTPVGRANEASPALCRALVAAERAAAKDACGTLAIAGAVTVVQGGRERLWLGLRAPLVDGKAALVRLARLDAFRFDAAALVDLAGNGVRELAAHRRSLLALAGPPLGARGRFGLYELALQPDETFAARLVRSDLVPSSAGLLPTDGGLVVLVDGAAGKDGACREPARQYWLQDPSADR